MIVRFILHHLQLLDVLMLLLPLLLFLVGWRVGRRRRWLGVLMALVGLLWGLGWAEGAVQ